MSRRGRVFLTAGLAVVLVFALTVGAFGANGTKTLSALYRNIKLSINGKVIQASEEPFIINGRTYVPLRVVGEALGAWVDWNEKTSVITIAGKTSNSAEEQLYQKDIQIAQLRIQVESLQEQLNKSPSTSSPSGTTDDDDIDELEKDLNDSFDSLEDVDIEEIILSGDEDDVKVTVEVDLGDFEDEWDDLSDNDIEDWLEDLCGEIQDFFSDDTEISGKIKDIDENETLVEFNKDGDANIDVEIEEEEAEYTISEVEDDLDGTDYTIEGVDFEIDDIDYDTGDNEIEVILIATEDGADEIDDDDLEDGAKDICKEIADTFEDDAGADPETIILEIYDEDWSSLGDYDYDVADEELS